MDRIFMAQENALVLLLKARQSAFDQTVGMTVEHADAKIEALNRLILDVRACRVNEFKINPTDDKRIIVAD